MPRHWDKTSDAALFTDLYALTMLQAYAHEGMEETAVFDFFVRRLPERWNYVIACGVADVLQFLEDLQFTDEALDYLAGLGAFSQQFLDYLAAVPIHRRRVRATRKGRWPFRWSRWSRW